MDVFCITCSAKDGKQFRFSSKFDMERHVAIVHGQSEFSTLRCGKCQRKFYDFHHFEEHTKWPPICNSNAFIMNREPLSTELKAAFDNLVVQSMVDHESITRDVAPSAAPSKAFIDVKTESPKNGNLIKPTMVPKTTPILVIDISDDENIPNQNVSLPLTPAIKIGNSATYGTPAIMNGTNSATRLTSAVISGNSSIFSTPAITNGSSSIPLTPAMIIDRSSATPYSLRSFTSIGNRNSLTVGRKSDTSSSTPPQIPGSMVKSNPNVTNTPRMHQKNSPSIARRISGERNKSQDQNTPISVIKGNQKITNHRHLIQSFCRGIFKKRMVGVHITCKICESTLKLSSSSTDNKMSYSVLAIDHATKHLDKPLYGCKFCEHKAASRGSMRSHLKSVHKRPGVTDNYYDYSSDYEKDIKTIITQCFDHNETIVTFPATANRRMKIVARSAFRSESDNPSDQGPAEQNENGSGLDVATFETIRNGLVENTPKRVKMKRMSDLQISRRDTAIQLMKRFADKTSGNIECLHCHKSICVKSRSRGRHVYGAYLPIDHAMVHLAKFPYSCKLCKYVTTSRKNILGHVRCKHRGVVGSGNSIIDISDQFHDEIMLHLKKCFDHGQARANAQLKRTGTGTRKREVSTESHQISKIIPPGIAKPSRVESNRGDNGNICRNCGWKTKFVVLMQRHLQMGICKKGHTQSMKVKTEVI